MLLVLFGLLLAGCAGESPVQQATSPSTSQAGPSDGEAVSGRDVAWQVVPTVPETLQAWVGQASRHTGVSTRPTEDGRQWVLIALGQRRTGGYSVEVVDVVALQDRIRVTYREHKPAPDTLTTQVITYPYTLIEVASSLPVEAVALSPR